MTFSRQTYLGFLTRNLDLVQIETYIGKIKPHNNLNHVFSGVPVSGVNERPWKFNAHDDVIAPAQILSYDELDVFLTM